jgi:molecular chaperone GrpE
LIVDVDAKSTDADPVDAAEGARQERDELQDRLLRTAAEFDNYRKRTDRERRELSEAVAGDLIRDVLPVVDDLERAIAAAADSPDPALRSGVELIYRQLMDVLRRRGAEPFESVGQDFDPAWHEALTGEPAGGRRDGEITAEIRRGYRIGSRLLRPALVKVAKA